MPILNTFSGGGGGIRIPLEAPVGFSATVSDGTVSFTWTDPVDKVANPGGELVSEWNYTLVVRKAGSAPLTPTDGYQVLRTTSRNQHTSTPFVDTGLDNDVTYYYAIYAYSTLGVPSEALVGNATPTYFASIKYLRSMGYGASFGSEPTVGRNGSFALFFDWSRDASSTVKNLASKIDANLSASSLSPTLNTAFSSSAKAGQYALFSTYDHTLSVDANAVQSEVDSGIFPSRAVALTSADVDGSVCYVCVHQPEQEYSPYYPEVRKTRRYTSELVSSNVGAVSQVTSSTVNPLSSKYYAILTGFEVHYVGLGTPPKNVFCYDTNGTLHSFSTPLCLNSEVGNSRCNEYVLIYGGDKESDQINHEYTSSSSMYSLSKDLVLSRMADTVKRPSNLVNALTSGLGVVALDKSPLQYYDKNLVLQGNVTNCPSKDFYGVCTRVGKYLMVTNRSASALDVFENA